MDNDKIYFSSCAFKSKTLKDLLSEANSVGIKNLELSGDLIYATDDRELIIKNSNNFNFMLHNYCFNAKKPFLLNLAADDLDERDHVIEHVKSLCDLTSEIGNSVYSLHWGYAFKSIYTPVGDSNQFARDKNDDLLHKES